MTTHTALGRHSQPLAHAASADGEPQNVPAPSTRPTSHAPDHSHLVALFDAAHEAMLLTSACGTVLAANERASRLFGRAPADFRGCQLLDFTDQQDARVREACIDRHRSGRFAGEMRMCRGDGSWFDAAVDSTVFRDAGDRLLAYVHIRPGIERRASAQPTHPLQASMSSRMETQQAQKLQRLGVQAGVIAHDFNNLLVGILGNVSMALAEIASDSGVVALLTDVETAALHAAALTRQLLAHREQGERVVEPIDLPSIVTEVVRLLQSVISTRAVLVVECAEEMPTVAGDATQLRHVVMNLLTNASDALEGRHGTITVRLGATWVGRDAPLSPWLEAPLVAGRYAYLAVEDSGSGMSADTQRRIFDPYFSTRRTGRGLGLANTLGIVREHRGALALDSAPGRGTTFRILLPVAVASHAAGAALAARPAPRATTSPSSGRLHARTLVDDPTRPGHGAGLVMDAAPTVGADTTRQMPLGCSSTDLPGPTEAERSP